MEALFSGSSLVQILFFFILIFANFKVTYSTLLDELEREDNLLNGINLRVSAFEVHCIDSV